MVDITHSPKRGEIYYLDFEEGRGRTMRDRHPALVIQNNIANRYSGVIIVVPLTTNLKVAELPVGIIVDPPEGGLRKRSVVHCGHIYSSDRQAFTRDCFSGHLSPTKMQEVNKALRISLDLT
jgi:mRNA interferase MazF